jgi:hypothetical protein
MVISVLASTIALLTLEHRDKAFATLSAIAKELGTRPTRVSKWRNRFAQLGIGG